MSLSLMAAFLGGAISLLSPCSAMVIPTFAAAAGKRQERLILTSVIFGLGLMTILAPLGFGATIVGRWMLMYREPVSAVLGALFLMLGALTLTGYKLPIPDLTSKLLPNRMVGGKAKIYLLGLVSGFGCTACVGPVFGAILTLAATSRGALGASYLMMSYGLGILIPLVVIAWLLDKAGSKRLGFIRKKSHLLVGALLILIGYVFLRYQGSLAQVPGFRGNIDLFFDLQEKVFSY